jgi:hypothetical protein
VMHTRREANMVAHLLAKGAFHTPTEKIWMEEYLDFIHNVHAESFIL